MYSLDRARLACRAGGFLALICLASVLLPGCVAFNVRIRTVVDERTACLRQIDYAGSAWEHFLMPTGEPWEVNRTDSGATVRALLKNPNAIGTDFVFDASQHAGDDEWLEFAAEKRVVEAKAQALRVSNRVAFRRTFLLIMYRYHYREELDTHRIPDFLRYQYLERRFAASTRADSADLAREALRLAARAFAGCQLTCAVQLPGRISSTNADWVEGQIGVWDVSPLEFREGQAVKVMEMTTRRYLWPNIAAISLLALAGLVRLGVVQVRRYRRLHRDPLWRIRS
ncbi:MAG: hypothetical protein H5U38_13255 [Calditrichaeota bacterium]|nr:hypothetical protein [Calditrichota bacterium]